MRPILRHTAYIKDGELFLDRAAHYRADVQNTFGDGPLLITTEELPPGPSNPMHRYYRGVVLSGVIDALNNVGNFVLNTDKNRKIVHDNMKLELLPDVLNWINPATGEVYGPEWSLADLPRPIYGKYLADIRELTLRLTGWEIPPPPVDWQTVDEILAEQVKEL